VQVDRIYDSLEIDRVIAAASEEEEAAVVDACQTALLSKAADKPRGTFRQLVPRTGGQLQSDLRDLAAMFINCVVADVQTAKAELGSVWKARPRSKVLFVIWHRIAAHHVASLNGAPAYACVRSRAARRARWSW
jgi:hypothetical protein